MFEASLKQMADETAARFTGAFLGSVSSGSEEIGAIKQAGLAHGFRQPPSVYAYVLGAALGIAFGLGTR